MIDIRITFTFSATTNPPNPPYQGGIGSLVDVNIFLEFTKRFYSYPPAPLLQAAIFCAVKTVARNEMEGGYTEGHANIQTRLTEPQGKIKIFDILRVSLYRTKCRVRDVPVARSARL